MSRTLDRRGFLKSLAAGGVGVAAQAIGLAAWPRAGQAAHLPGHTSPGCGLWGDLVGTVGGAGGWNCGNHAGFKILDIYLYGGASQWETLWLPGNGGGVPSFTGHGMDSPSLERATLNWGANVANFPCQPPDIPPAFGDAQFFAVQTGGGRIYWGAPARPLYRRADILSRCRMVTQYHDLLPHEAAIPYCLTGLKLGNPRLAGTGAAIQRRARELFPAQVLPASYVLHTGVPLPEFAAAATGEHPGYSRPLVIRVQNNNNFVNSLGRSGITAESDELFLALRHEYRDRLRYRGGGNPIRSAGFDGYWVAAELLKDAPSLQALFQNDLLVIDSNVAVCATHPNGTAGNSHGTKTMLHAAASLLSSGPARYVGVVDPGRTGNYDTHGDGAQMHLLRTSANFYDVLHHLADIIHHPVNNPSGTLNLADTMVVINTEFGRTNGVNAQKGRDHWTVGYVSTLIGGPLSGGASIRGAIELGGAQEGYAVAAHRYSPTDVRAAILLAAGIDPFAAGNFRVSDFSDALTAGIGTEADIRDRLRGWILGL
jgi:hypothetical protein